METQRENGHTSKDIAKCRHPLCKELVEMRKLAEDMLQGLKASMENKDVKPT